MSLLLGAVNPYSGETFFGFFSVLVQRVFSFFLGRGCQGLVSDEIQCLVLIFLAFSLSFLGSFLVARQMTMLANALSHTLLLGIVSAFFLFKVFGGGETLLSPFTSMKVLWVAALVTGVLTTALTELLRHKLKVQEDASIGLVFTTLFALGILFVTLFTRNLHLGVEAITGNIDALHVADLKTVGGVALVVFLFYFLFFRGFLVSAFDPIFAKSISYPTKTLNYLLMILTAGGAIASFRAVGVILFLSFLVGPVLVARLYVETFKKQMFLGFFVSSTCSIVSVALSRHILTVYRAPVSTGALTVSILFCVYLLSLFVAPKKGILSKCFFS